MIKICPRCSQEFEDTTGRKRFCGRFTCWEKFRKATDPDFHERRIIKTAKWNKTHRKCKRRSDRKSRLKYYNKLKEKGVCPNCKIPVNGTVYCTTCNDLIHARKEQNAIKKELREDLKEKNEFYGGIFKKEIKELK